MQLNRSDIDAVQRGTAVATHAHVAGLKEFQFPNVNSMPGKTSAAARQTDETKILLSNPDCQQNNDGRNNRHLNKDFIQRSSTHRAPFRTGFARLPAAAPANPSGKRSAQ
jgi:hypothetical protein